MWGGGYARSMLKAMRLWVVLAAVAGSLSAQTTVPLRALPGKDAVRAARSAESFSATHEVRASFQATLLKTAAGKRGEAWLEFSLESPKAAGERVMVRIPLSSTRDAYGEERACRVGKDGRRELTFTAGLDEPNFVEFRAAKGAHDFSFLLNKYLCRVLASPFHCGGEEVSLPKDWASWKMARRADVRLSSDAAAEMWVSPVFVVAGEKAFDYGRCAVEAPSNGICCVMGRTTAWHCGGKPEGDGWHQVSGECWHRETGGSCSE